jgi:hypothetical protein
VHAAFGTVLWVVCIAGAVCAVLGLFYSRQTWEDLGKDRLVMDSELPRGPRHSSAASLLERDEEIRQMLTARNARRIKRGEPPLDIEQELSKLTSSTADPALQAEVRQLVQARNYRRVRAGKPALDIEAEVERELAKLSNL